SSRPRRKSKSIGRSVCSSYRPSCGRAGMRLPALAGTLPELVTDADIKGILHAHTDRSDGVDTLETMAEATLARGYQYFGVADHSKSAHYAGSLSAERLPYNKWKQRG